MRKWIYCISARRVWGEIYGGIKFHDVKGEKFNSSSYINLDDYFPLNLQIKKLRKEYKKSHDGKGKNHEESIKIEIIIKMTTKWLSLVDISNTITSP